MTSKKYDLLVLIGRFQPLHNGHLEIIKDAISKTKNLLIIVGSAGEPSTVKNPWSYDVRYQILNDVVMRLMDKDQFLFIRKNRDYLDDNDWISSTKKIIKETQLTISGYTGYGVGTKDIKTGIIGCDKDHSTWYLKAFPDYELELIEQHSDIDATSIRKHLFNHNEIPSDKVPYNPLYLDLPNLDMLRKEFFYYQDYQKKNPPVDDQGYMLPKLTADNIILRNGKILLVERKNCPGEGKLALPGGFVDPGETFKQAADRELLEEVGLKAPNHADIYFPADKPGRSLRGNIISMVYCYYKMAIDLTSLKVQETEVKRFVWMDLLDIVNDPYYMSRMFFDDHWHLIEKYYKLSTERSS